MSYMKDAAGKRLDGFVVPDRYDTAPPWEPPIAPVPSPAIIPDATIEYLNGAGGSKRWGWMSDDGLRLYNWNDPILRVSYDGTSTLSLSTAFARNLTFSQETSDGELIACVTAGATAPTDPPGEVWKSTGYNAAAHTVPSTWTKVLTLQDGGAWVDRFSHHSYGALMFLSEYGLKGTTYAAKKAYCSADSGSTWHAMFTHPQPDATNAHIHGIAYDRWWDRVWISLGDGSANRGIYVSDNWRLALTGGTPTWTKIPGSDTTQVTGIMPMRDVVLFASDNAPNGVTRYRRKGFRTVGSLETAYLLNNGSNNDWVGNTVYRRDDTSPVLMTFSPSDTPKQPSVLVATWDGLTFYSLWTEPHTYDLAYSQGLFSAFGPFLATNKIVGDLRDDRNGANGYTIFRAPMPTWAKIPTTPKPDGTTYKLKIDSSGVFYTEAPDGTQTYPGSSVTLADGSVTPAKLSFQIDSPQASDRGLLGWSMDPNMAPTQSALNASGTAHVIRIPVRKACTISNIILRLNVLGASLTGGYVALYQNGTLLAQSADQSANWQSPSSTGVKTIALATPQAVAAGYVDVLIWAVGTTMPSFARGSTSGDFLNAGAATLWFATANTGLTTTAPGTIGTRTSSTGYCVLLS